MNKDLTDDYNRIRSGEVGFYEQKRGLIAVWGREAVQFLNGLITNDVAKLEDGAQMLAAFPNAQGRLLAVVRVMRKGEKFLFETEKATSEKVYNNLFRFTFAGDFFVEDLSEKYDFVSIIGRDIFGLTSDSEIKNEALDKGDEVFLVAKSLRGNGNEVIVPKEFSAKFIYELKNLGHIEISNELYESLRIENGVPLYGKDMDETTIVPELGIDGLISYNKGCYIGQEIIARIYFRGHVAKELRGLVFENEAADIKPQDELKTVDGKNAGRITSVTFSPKLGRKIALGFVRYDHLAEGTELKIGDAIAHVKNLPFLQ